MLYLVLPERAPLREMLKDFPELVDSSPDTIGPDSVTLTPPHGAAGRDSVQMYGVHGGVVLFASVCSTLLGSCAEPAELSSFSMTFPFILSLSRSPHGIFKYQAGQYSVPKPPKDTFQGNV